MADALAGKRISTITYIAPDENASEAMRDYLSSHKEFMAAKCYREGPLRLLHYFFQKDQSMKKTGAGLKENIPKKQEERFFIYITCTKTKKEFNTIGLKFLNSYQCCLS